MAELLAEAGLARPGEHVESMPALAATGNAAVAPRRYQVERLPADLREATTPYAGVEALNWDE